MCTSTKYALGWAIQCLVHMLTRVFCIHFLMKKAFERPKSPIFFRCARRIARVMVSAGYHPHIYAQKVELHLSADPQEPCTRPKKIVFYHPL